MVRGARRGAEGWAAHPFLADAAGPPPNSSSADAAVARLRWRVEGGHAATAAVPEIAPARESGGAGRLSRLRELFPFVPATTGEVLAALPPGTSSELVLARLARASFRERGDLVGDLNRIGGSGGQFGRFIELESEFLKANHRRRYASLAEAVAHEVASEELRIDLGIYHPRRVWFISHGSDGHCWACSLTPRLVLLRTRFNELLDRRAWLTYLAALRGAFELVLERRAVLDCNPNNFGEELGRLFYVDDDVGRRTAGASLALQALLRLREYPQARPEDRAEFVAGLCQLCREFGRDPELARGIEADLSNEVLWPVELPLRERLAGLRKSLGSTRKRNRS